MFATMLSMDAYVPRTKPKIPSRNMKQSLVSQTGHGRYHKNILRSLSGQKVNTSRIVGKMKARALLAKAPMREIKSARSGTASAKMAACKGKRGGRGKEGKGENWLMTQQTHLLRCVCNTEPS